MCTNARKGEGAGITYMVYIPKVNIKSNTSTAYGKPVYAVSGDSNVLSSNRSHITLSKKHKSSGVVQNKKSTAKKQTLSNSKMWNAEIPVLF